MPKECRADSGYGSEENYFFMEAHGTKAYVKYNLFHKEQKQDFKNDCHDEKGSIKTLFMLLLKLYRGPYNALLPYLER